MSAKLERIRRLVNKLNIGANKEKLGDVLVDIIAEIEDLKARVEELEKPGQED